MNGSRYRTINKAMTFYAAQEQCRRLGGYLARINSIREQVFLEDFLQQELQIEGRRHSDIRTSFSCGVMRRDRSNNDYQNDDDDYGDDDYDGGDESEVEDYSDYDDQCSGAIINKFD